jgi:kynurenine formamidase
MDPEPCYVRPVLGNAVTPVTGLPDRRRIAMTGWKSLAMTVGLVGALGSLSVSGQQQPVENQSMISKAQWDQWFKTLSNWGRWGKDDERGALNLITAAKAKAAGALVKTGQSVSLSKPISRDKPPSGPEPRPVKPGGAYASFFLIDNDVLYERQEIEYHGGRLSHFDALCHVSHEGKTYNGYNFKEIVTQSDGCKRLSVNSAKDGIVTRAVLVDLPGKRVTRADLEAWEKKTGVRVSSGDALILRSTRPGLARGSFGAAGYDPSVIPFLKERDVALLGNDMAQEGGMIPGLRIPMHSFVLVALGINLLDNLNLDDVAATAAKLNRYDFMLVVGPLPVENGAGSAVNAVAIF